MLSIKKFVIGIRPASKMFRVPSVGGLMIDSILSARGTKPIDDEYYKEVATNFEVGTLLLKNDELGNLFKVDLSNILFIKDSYDTTKFIDLDKAISEFSVIWQIIDNILKVRDIRRIGILAEHQIQVQNGNINKKLLEVFTRISPPLHPAKCHLRYEERDPTTEGIAPDIDKSDFINVIYDYYDGEIDADHSNPNVINANIDVQKYYSPLLTSKIPVEVNKLLKIFIDRKKKFDTQLKEWGIIV